MMFLQSGFASFLVLATTAFAWGHGPVTKLTIDNKDISPDGFSRAASVVNGMHPGPVITAKKGDKLKINVVNRLWDPQQLRGMSMHWHGILQKDTVSMDGSDGVSQCPIAPNNSFLYSFTAENAGTHWYHSHFGVQYCDGVRGALIVYDHCDPHKDLYDVDDESTIVSLIGWYHTLSASIVGIASGDSTLINGKGRFPGGPNVDLAVINVHKGKRYRLRLIAMSCEPNFKFSIDDHDLTVIEADGVSTKPHTVDMIQIFAGQRYSVVLNANQNVGNYWIRALPSFGSRNLNDTFEDGVNSAILRYKGARIAEPTTCNKTTQNNLIEADLHPLSNPIPPGDPNPNGADYVFNITLTVDLVAFKYLVNGVVYEPPTVPVLLQIMNGARTAQELLPPGSVFVVERNKTVQVNFNSGLVGGPHPFHLHGHTFSVIRSADTGRFNFLDPVQRDTVNLGDTVGDQVSIRFRTDNPGPWLFHCHIFFHFVDGLGFIFAEAPEQVSSLKPTPPAEWDQLCPNWNAVPDAEKTAEPVPNTSASAEPVPTSSASVEPAPTSSASADPAPTSA